jgi:hypothetical protein
MRASRLADTGCLNNAPHGHSGFDLLEDDRGDGFLVLLRELTGISASLLTLPRSAVAVSPFMEP